ncbi:hypothetical protein AURDEDRAFT_181399 [Auricularia subglabra TFB-10046 SS5]|nr:hypothetical protein AURDEDRAFT_181399 [Auricularia subglabra TFB-10046 SS5]
MTPPSPAPSRAQRALDAQDWDELRRLSLEPRGFGDDRASVWTYLLDPQQLPGASTGQHDARQSRPPSTERVPPPEHVPHDDERQILLDTNRSFVLYPVDDERKDELKRDLNEAIVSTFRRRPKLHYFQGYHDIVSVLFLTLPSESLPHAVEKMSLHRLRDSMGNGLEPMIGQLRIMKRLLRLADPHFSAMVESTTPLPYYALSNLLTLFSHDVPTLPLIQHIFDYLLCRPPIASIYLTVAVILSHEDAVRKLVEEDEEGMLHSVLTTFPPVQDSTEPPSRPAQESHSPPLLSHHPRQETGSSWMQPSPPPSEAPLLDDVNAPSSESTVAESEAETGSMADSESAPLLSDSWTATSPPPRADALVSEAHLPHSASDAETKEDDASTLADTPPTISASRPLADLLKRADDLYTRFPPTDPRLAVDRIMGPQSVLFTWSEPSRDSEDQNQITDDEAEAMVDAPELVVRFDFQDEDELEEMERRQARRRISEPAEKASAWWPPNPTTVLAGVVLAVSIGIAVYDIQRRAQGKRDS